jgi:ankyrin repeat protein
LRDEDGRIPLHLAAKNGSYEIVQLLLTKGAEVTIEDNGGLTPLHLAIEGGSKA